MWLNLLSMISQKLNIHRYNVLDYIGVQNYSSIKCISHLALSITTKWFFQDVFLIGSSLLTRTFFFHRPNLKPELFFFQKPNLKILDSAPANVSLRGSVNREWVGRKKREGCPPNKLTSSSFMTWLETGSYSREQVK